MYRWLVRISRKDQPQETIAFGIRPNITTGDGMLRLASLEGEQWVPMPVEKIEVFDTGVQAIQEILANQDFDDLTERALDLCNSDSPDQKVMGQIVLAAIRHEKLQSEVKAQIEAAQARATEEANDATTEES